MEERWPSFTIRSLIATPPRPSIIDPLGLSNCGMSSDWAASTMAIATGCGWARANDAGHRQTSDSTCLGQEVAHYCCLIFSPASFAARSIVPATTFGCVMKTAWLAETLVMSAPMRSAI